MSHNKPQEPTILGGGIILPNEQMGLDVTALDNVVRARGVPLIHMRAIKCPVGLLDPSDMRRTHEDHAGCSNGFLYYPQGRVTATLTSNATQLERLDVGFIDGSTIMATFPRYYDSDPDKRVMVRPFDRFYIDQADILTGTWVVTRRRMDDNNDRLEFPAVQVEILVDSNNVSYFQNIDFDLVKGDIAWRSGKGPDVGTVYSCWFQHVPFWYCERMLHELRLWPEPYFLDTNNIHLERSGSGAILVREYAHRTETPDENAPEKTKDKQGLPPDIDEV